MTQTQPKVKSERGKGKHDMLLLGAKKMNYIEKTDL